MGIEFSPNTPDPFSFTERDRVPTIHVQTEQAQISYKRPKSCREKARQADLIWVSNMRLLAQMKGESGGVLALSDGVTSHVVACLGITQGQEDYLVEYHDSWPPEMGSFLEQGKNVAGCAAIRCKEGNGPWTNGYWTITAEELFRVLDSVVLMGPNNKVNGKTKDAPTDA